MRERRLPRLGLLGLMTDGYEPIFPGITSRQEAYAREIVHDLADVAEIYFPGAAMNRADIESKVRDMNSRDLPSDLFTGLVACARTAGKPSAARLCCCAAGPDRRR